MLEEMKCPSFMPEISGTFTINDTRPNEHKLLTIMSHIISVFGTFIYKCKSSELIISGSNPGGSVTFIIIFIKLPLCFSFMMQTKTSGLMFMTD